MKTKFFLPLLLIPLLSGCHLVPNTYNYDNADKYSQYSSTTEITNTINNLEINYVSGSVVVEKGERFLIEETEHEYPLYYWNNSENEKLSIQFVQNGLNLDNKHLESKSLKVTVPYSLTKLSLNLISARFTVNLSSLNVDTLNVNTISGSGTASVNSNKTTLINTISGNVNLSLISTLQQESINISSVSASSTLNLDKKRGFETSFNSLSGIIDNQFGIPEDESLEKYSIIMESVSGNLTIIKNS